MEDRGGRKNGGTSNIEHRTSNIEHRTSNIEHRTSNIEHRTSNIEHRTSNIQHRTSNIEHPTSNIEHRTSNIQHPTSNIEHPTSNIQHRTSNIQHRTSNIQHPTSNIQHPTSNIQQYGATGGGACRTLPPTLMATAERRFLPRRLVSAKQCEDGSFQAKAGPIRRVSAGIATTAGPDSASPIHPSLGSSFGGQGLCRTGAGRR
jgi:uncharacterized protein (DUF3084 family)